MAILLKFKLAFFLGYKSLNYRHFTVNVLMVTPDTLMRNHKHFYYLMLNQIFPGLSTKIFRICTSSMKITIWIPVADLSLDQACIYHLQSHHKIEYTVQNSTNGLLVIDVCSREILNRDVIFTNSGERKEWNRIKFISNHGPSRGSITIITNKYKLFKNACHL